MIGTLFSRLMILFFGSLYPGYASYKAIRTKDFTDCSNWLMYWIVYAGFTCIENIADVLLFWFPLYYEIKVILVMCLISPAIKGSPTLYLKLVQPMLELHEDEIDEYLKHIHDKGYSTFMELSSKAANYISDAIMQSGMKVIHITSSWAAQANDMPRSSTRKQFTRHHQECALSDIETYCNEQMIITELAGDDIDKYSLPFQRKNFKTSKSDLTKLSEAMKEAKKSIDNGELFFARSYSSSSIDTGSSKRSIPLNVFNQQLATDEFNQEAHLFEPVKPMKETNALKGMATSSAAGKRCTRSTTRIKLSDAKRGSSKKTSSPLWMS